jgi:aminoglycoside phosphotransferase (APT) family kinase protein
MTSFYAEYASLAPLLPEGKVGTLVAIRAMPRGPSAASVYLVTTTEGELVLKVQAAPQYASRWAQQLVVQRQAAECGIAPAIVHVDEAARAVVSRRVAGVPIAAIAAPEERGRAIGALVDQLRVLHRLERDGIEERDPLALARGNHAVQRARPGFPEWARELAPIFYEIEATLARDPRRTVSHNDANPGNVLWDGTRAWLVDWEVAGLAHPSYDLATLAMFVQLAEDVAVGLLTQLEGGRPIEAAERATFAALRRLAALLCGLSFVSLLPDLSVVPASAPTLTEFYAELRAGRFTLHDPRGGGAFAAALLRQGIGDAAKFA